VTDSMRELWMAEGACVSMKPDYFFPEPVGNVVRLGKRVKSAEELHKEEVAKEACATCPVRKACWDYAEAHMLDNGIWGGEASDERKMRWKKRFGNIHRR
jgi:WhiB family redox-sensing transcriptional regulator